MKKLSKIFLICPLLFIGVGCSEEQNLSTCLSGIVIGSENCNSSFPESIFIDVLNDDKIGGDITLNGISYLRAVRSLSGIGKHETGDTIYFTYRELDENEIRDFYDDEKPCYTYGSPYHLPTIVITQSSTSNCPPTTTNESKF